MLPIQVLLRVHKYFITLLQLVVKQTKHTKMIGETACHDRTLHKTVNTESEVKIL